MSSENTHICKSFATTLHYNPDNSEWMARARPLAMPYISPAPHSTFDEIKRVWRLLRCALREPLLLLDSTSGRFHPDLITTALIGLLPRRFRPVIVFMGAMWEPSGGLRGRIERRIIRMADRAVWIYVVQSSEELTVFPTTWDVDPAKLRRCLYFYTLTAEELAAPPPEPPDKPYIFAGGNAHRDYDALIDAARLLPEVDFVLATSRVDQHNLPENVHAEVVPHAEFVDLMRGAAAVVTPMKQGLKRATGQQTYLNAMMFGKPCIVNKAFAVHDHLEHGKTALIVDGSPQGYADALRWVLDPANQDAVRQMVETGRETVAARYTFEAHAACLLRVLDEFAERMLPLDEERCP